MSQLEFEVILTHEHTDFDALASLLGASLLNPDAYPVLPHQLNRNVREFLALYRNHFPFLTHKELPKGHVARAIFVDTRSANWTKGMDKRTHFTVIDHHSLHEELPDGWDVWTDEVGANTTLLVEKLMAQNARLSPVHATLLALGIHEDTGSLTYVSTTDRDARCLAWLLDSKRGVNLSVMAHFLNHPLTDAQRTVFEELVERSEFLEIRGHSAVICRADAPGFSDEISALASRARDFFEAEATFLVIDLGDMVQVVARSTVDDIDVGAVARALGGGGHTRAAAAAVHAAGTEEVRARIVDLLHETVRSAVTVRNIMSMGRPQMLTPQMTIAQAHELMQRWGHEGFPVVENGEEGRQLIGVLTRREADRAVNHSLGDAPVRRFMRAGQVTVHPDDSIATLRRRMIDSNWGQIPVVDDDGAIIGIVTRTDLIKLWDEVSLPEQEAAELAERLARTLTPVQHALLQLVGREVDRMNYTVYIVGGFVRDLLLESDYGRIPGLDMDIVIEGDAIGFAEHMQTLYGGRVVPHKRFRTAKWLLTDADHPVNYAALARDLGLTVANGDLPAHLDFVTARIEFYTAPTALPTVERSSIKLDLHRRDFTINTLALCLNPDRWAELLDSYGGINDLRLKLVRVLHSLSFVDDPTRILRAVRYEQRFRFTIEPRTLELLEDAIDMIDRMSGARIRHELERILQEEMPEYAMRRLDELGVLARLHPALIVDDWVMAKFAALRCARAEETANPRLLEEPQPRQYWGVLTYRQPREVDAQLVERLALRGETQRLVEALERLRGGDGARAAPIAAQRSGGAAGPGVDGGVGAGPGGPAGRLLWPAHGWQRTWPSGATSSRRWTGTICARWGSPGGRSTARLSVAYAPRAWTASSRAAKMIGLRGGVSGGNPGG
ncbi:MAG: CBS domain-containing protein [Caldilineaceae bacterium]